MKTDEIKFRLVRYINTIIDMYMPNNTLVNRLKNSTAKFWIEQNTYKLDSILKAFADENGCIDTDKLVSTYGDCLFRDGDLRLDIRDMIPENMSAVKSMLPDSILMFRKEDLMEIFK